VANFRNREYHRRAARQALRVAGGLALYDPNTGFYRPALRPVPYERREQRKPRAVPAEQMSLDFEERKPLQDLFPEAYLGE